MTIALHNLTAGYDRHPAVHHLNGRFQAGSLTAVVGPNGGGKSTLLKTLVGLLRPMSGRIDYNGIRPCDIAYLPQQSKVDRSFPLSVEEVVMFGLWSSTGAFRSVSATQRQAVAKALEQVGMKAFAERPIEALSTGQWQRVLFARLMVQDARVLILDEPFAAIDTRTTHDLMHLLQQWQREGRTVITVIHDLNFVRENFSQSLMLARELIGWGATGGVLCDENLARAAALAGNWVEDAAACHRDERLSA